jgi:hypothetical protein
MSDAVLAAIAALGADLSAEIVQSRAETAADIATSRAETARLIEGVHSALDGIREDLTVLGAANDRTRRSGENTRDEGREIANSLANIERILLKHGTRLDDLEKRLPKQAS